MKTFKAMEIPIAGEVECGRDSSTFLVRFLHYDFAQDFSAAEHVFIGHVLRELASELDARLLPEFEPHTYTFKANEFVHTPALTNEEIDF